MRRFLIIVGLLMATACCHTPKQTETPDKGEMMKEYMERYPAAEPQDLYKMVFQDLYGPGHLIDDPARCGEYIKRETATMEEGTKMPAYEYTLFDSNYVRINLTNVRDGKLSVEELADAVVRSAEGIDTPDGRFVLSHSKAFKEAYSPHYRIVSRKIFEEEIKPKIIEK